MKRTLTIVLFIAFGQTISAQKLKHELFVRSLHIVNLNLTNQSIFYSPGPSAGITLRYKNVFIDFGGFINKGDDYGFYTFFGSILKVVDLDNDWKLVKAWFGETVQLIEQGEDNDYWIFTSGLNNALVRSFKWGAVSVPFTIGVAYSEQTYSLNIRAVLNLSIPLGKRSDE